MARYVDGFVLPLPKRNLALYKRMSTAAGSVWMEHGALQYLECLGDDLDHKGLFWPFSRTVKCKPGETVVFSWVVFKNRKHRDQVNRKIMADKRILGMMTDPVFAKVFDSKRMAYGGFKTIVEKGR